MHPTEKNRNPLWGNVFQSLIKKKDHSRIDLISKIPIFQELSPRELRTVSEILFDRVYEAGEDIFLTDQPGAAMFIITSGRVRILVENDDETGDSILAELEEGDFFGEIALLDSSPRSATARAVTKTELLAIFRADLDKLIMNEPYIAARIMKQLAIVIGMRLKETNRQFTSIASKTRT